MGTRRISVALCTFNGAAYLSAQLRSIADQTVAVDEIVVGDDGSDDATLEILHDAARDLPQLRVLEGAPRAGVAANFERTILQASGDVILLSDQDDIWHRDRAAASIARFEADPEVELVHSDACLIDRAGAPLAGSLLTRLGLSAKERAALLHGDAFDALMRRNLMTGATMAIRRTLAERAAPFPASWLHDEWLAIIAADSGTTRLLDDSLIDYRLHGENQVGVEHVTARVRLSRLSADRTSRNARLLARADALVDRGLGGAHGSAALAKATHERVRSSYPSARVRRWGPALSEWRTGRYSRYGLGAHDLLRDLVQPAPATL